jgi:hypothetical protein
MRGISYLVSILLARCVGSARDAAVTSRDFPEDPKNLIRPKSPLDDLAHQVQNVAARARAVAADARSSAAESAGRVSSEETVISQYTAEHLANTVPYQEPYLKATVREATKQKENTQAAAAAAEGGYNTAILKQKEEVANAAAWASQETEKILADPMMKLQEWKMEVLHDPLSEAKIAAEKAARPYRLAVAGLHRRISEYTKRADSLNSQAFAIQSAAMATAGVQKALMNKPTPAHWKTAMQLYKSSQHNLMQAAIFNAQAKKLEMMASKMELNFQAYQAGGEAAAQVAAHWYAPHIFAPEPGRGMAAWAPPGPPIPFVLTQTEAKGIAAKGPRGIASSESSAKSSSEDAAQTAQIIKPHRKEGNPFQRRRVPV